MKILLIDNYDSFTYNIVHLLRQVGASQVDVIRNTEVNLSALEDYKAVIASPGPGLPQQNGKLLSTIEKCLLSNIPYLGICLGHQALGVVTSSTLIQLDQVCHGIQHPCTIKKKCELLAEVKEVFQIGRYHSWSIDPTSLSESIEVLAQTPDGVIQAIKVKEKQAFGVQFHPESILSPIAGPQILKNFLSISSQHHA